MGWLYIDDGLPEHPKALAAGGDAMWLWVCGLAYVNRNDTGGTVPKLVLDRISDRKNPKKLAARLVDAGLWEDKGDSYHMHDYEIWNAKALARKAAARKAATARWDPGGDAAAMPSHMRSHANGNAKGGNATAMPTPNPHPQSPDLPPTPQPLTWPSDRTVPGVLETEIERERAGQTTYRVVQLLAGAGGWPDVTQVLNLVQWALTSLDFSIVDEAISYAESLEKKPRSVAYLAKMLTRWAAQRGVEMPAFARPRKAS